MPKWASGEAWGRLNLMAFFPPEHIGIFSHMLIFFVAEGGRGENWLQKVLIYETKLR